MWSDGFPSALVYSVWGRLSHFHPLLESEILHAATLSAVRPRSGAGMGGSHPQLHGKKMSSPLSPGIQLIVG